MKKRHRARAIAKPRRASKAATAFRSPLSATSAGPPGLVAVPCVAWIWTEVMPSFMYLESSLPDGSYVAYTVAGSTICGKRNNAVDQMLNEPTFEWLLFVDSDMILPKGALQRLLYRKADIVGGMYCLREEPYAVVAGHVLERGQSDDPLRPTQHPDFLIRTLSPVMIARGDVPVDVCGTGVMLIHRRVLESMDSPWFVPNERPNCAHGQNEDYNFCLRASDQGFTIACDTSVTCGHVGTTNITPEYAMQWFKAHGRVWAEEYPDANMRLVVDPAGLTASKAGDDDVCTAR
ncbi:MAG: glycosyltransferase [Gemmatimonadetes bacterium]|nr:glycosyltransferase [Gemmatimonadota bacterium]